MVAVLGWLWTVVRAALDRRAVHAWLQANTRDEPGESHVAVVAIAKGTRRSEERVRAACVIDSRILRHGSDAAELWSVWREEPQSIYEKRSVLVIGGAGDVPGDPLRGMDWREMECRFGQISGEVDASRNTFRASGQVEWSLHARPILRRIGNPAFNRALGENLGDPERRLQRFEAEAKVAARLWLRQQGRSSDRDLVDLWLDVLATVVRPSGVTGLGRDERGEHDSVHFDGLIDASKVACVQFAADLESA